MCWRVLFSSYIASFFASFLASIFGRFLVRFWCYFGGLLGLQIDHFSVFYRVLFSFVFCIDFWSILAPIWGSFWEALGGPSRSFWASIFGLFLDVRAHAHAHGPPARTRTRTHILGCPKSGQERPKSGQERPKSGQDRAKSGQEQPKSANKKATVAKISKKRFGLKCSKHTQSKKQR